MKNPTHWLSLGIADNQSLLVTQHEEQIDATRFAISGSSRESFPVECFKGNDLVINANFGKQKLNGECAAENPCAGLLNSPETDLITLAQVLQINKDNIQLNTLIVNFVAVPQIQLNIFCTVLSPLLRDKRIGKIRLNLTFNDGTTAQFINTLKRNYHLTQVSKNPNHYAIQYVVRQADGLGKSFESPLEGYTEKELSEFTSLMAKQNDVVNNPLSAIPSPVHTTPIIPPKQSLSAYTWLQLCFGAVAVFSGILIPMCNNRIEANPFAGDLQEAVFGMCAAIFAVLWLAQCWEAYDAKKHKAEGAGLKSNWLTTIYGGLMCVCLTVMALNAFWSMLAVDALTHDGYELDNLTEKLYSSLYSIFAGATAGYLATELYAWKKIGAGNQHSLPARLAGGLF